MTQPTDPQAEQELQKKIKLIKEHLDIESKEWVYEGIDQLLTTERERVIKEVEGLRKDGVEPPLPELQAIPLLMGYNQALDDVLALLKKVPDAK